MPFSTRNWIQRIFHNAPANQLNAAYNLFNKIYKKEARFLESVMPRILPTQRQVEQKAAIKLAQVLMVIKLDYLKKNREEAYFQLISKRQEYRKELYFRVLEMLSKDTLKRSGSSIFLKDEDIEPLATFIGVPQEHFQKKATDLKILWSVMDDPSKLSYLRNELIEFGEEQYTLQYYRVVTKDGVVNNLTMLIDDARVAAGDKNPSIVLVPGIGCNSNAFMLNERYAMARNLARRGYWVYLYEPRGMGRNKVNFDVDCNLDTLIDYDLPAVIDFIYKRSKGKPVILLGHSMGGVISEFMLQLWSLQNDDESLSKVKGLITLGFPAHFDRNSHITYPFFLWLNYLLPFLKVDRVPLDETLMVLTKTPLLKDLFRMLLDSDIANMSILIHPKNISDPNFMFDFTEQVVESFPLGIGFQFQKAIYTGKGITRMDDFLSEGGERYNYTRNIGKITPNIPIVHFLGADDPLSPPDLCMFADAYRHPIKNVVYLDRNYQYYDLSCEPGKLTYFIVPETKHIDLLYGKTATKYIYPLISQAVEAIFPCKY